MLLNKMMPPYSFELRSLTVMKRGVCNFVEKARGLVKAGAELGLMISTDNNLLDSGNNYVRYYSNNLVTNYGPLIYVENIRHFNKNIFFLNYFCH
jgi:hypothetical protein